MTLFLLDTSAVSDLVADPGGRIATRIRQVGANNVCTSVVVSAEIAFGVEQKRSEALARRVGEILRVLPVLPFEQPGDRIYGSLRAAFKAQGRPIGPNDLFIASHALALGATLVTDNEREFRRVPDLPVENWLRS